VLNKFNIAVEDDPVVRNIFMVCPNFEERSIGFLDNIVDFDSANLNFFITKLQGTNPEELLDEIKEENTNRVRESLEAGGIKYAYEKFQYPIRDLRQYTDEILNYIKSVTSECNLYIDISSMPRNIIFRFLDFLFANIYADYIKIDQLIIKSVRICYTPAIAYPSTANIDQIGGINGIYKSKPFHQLIRQYEKVDVMMFLAGNTHDSSQTYSQSHEDGVNSRVSRHLLVFLNQDNLIHSYKKIGENVQLLTLAMKNNDKTTYFYSIEHLSSILYQEVNSIYERNESSKSSFLALGAYGTKTICLCSYLAKKRYNILSDNSKNHESDILDSNIGQYVSIYSIGKKESEYYKINLIKLTDTSQNK
jgi:hypothetical protein